MAIIVHLSTNGVMSEVVVPKGVAIDFSHPGSPMRVLSKDDVALLIVHPHQWVYAERNEEK